MTTLQDLIPIVNKLQDAFASMANAPSIDLPQIAVVGGQSAGKSSVLENCVGKDFLPRGSGIVTRRPLVLQLNHVPKGEWGEFLHAKGRKFTNFEEIRKEIEDETDRMTGSNKGISNIPINLRVFSPNVLNLTLIDLPGLTKVAVGDQPVDIEQQIRDMIMHFIAKPNCLILAVSPANSDLANSDALKMAKEVDPQGLRTIGVVTKLDLMDEGTDAKDILENKHIPLRRGYIGVVNRSQKDIMGNKDIKAAQEAERRYFLSHPSYRHLADRCGTSYLQKTLNQQLTNHIRETLPSIRQNLQDQLNRLEPEVADMKKFNPDDPNMKTKVMMSTLYKFSDDFKSIVEGVGTNIDLAELSGGCRINAIFHEKLPLKLAKVEFDENEIRREISIAIRNVSGVRGSIFTPNMAFDIICKKQIRIFHNPANEVIDLVCDELRSIVSKLCSKINKYPSLSDEIDRACRSTIVESAERCKRFVDVIIDGELAYINTRHPDFESASTKKKGKKDGQGIQVVRKGMLTTTNVSMLKGGSKEYWFVLTADTLAWYKDEKEEDQKYLLQLEHVKLRETDTGKPMFGRKCGFALFNPSAKNLFKDQKQLELSNDDEEYIEGWKSSFLRAGVYPDKGGEESVEMYTGNDPHMERNVEKIRSMVDSYVTIVINLVKDRVPKSIVHIIIMSLRNFVDEDISSYIYDQNVSDLMCESPGEEERRRNVLQLYKASREALDIINDVNTKTTSTPVPPPVENSIQVEAVARPASRPSGSRPSAPTTKRPPLPKGNSFGSDPAPSRPPPGRSPAPTRPVPAQPPRPSAAAVPKRPSRPARPT
ncbi:dynamin-1-like [Sycon ciliatum]|uniref:dynamin-1-like n=1 Tax=Sycon ciliatum TaxID=27933 RepID=UPI0031F63FC3|eukprot:scpid64446/ scgid13721/ Dynamin-1